MFMKRLRKVEPKGGGEGDGEGGQGEAGEFVPPVARVRRADFQPSGIPDPACLLDRRTLLRVGVGPWPGLAGYFQVLAEGALAGGGAVYREFGRADVR